MYFLVVITMALHSVMGLLVGIGELIILVNRQNLQLIDKMMLLNVNQFGADVK
jgi:hypothetical protein